MSIWIQITAGQGGPAECCRVVTRIADLLSREAALEKCELQILEQVAGDYPDTHQSVIFTTPAEEVPAWLTTWIGTIQWIGTSEFRPTHKRKNWFVGVQVVSQPAAEQWNRNDIKLETFRSSGPGGQNVNKVESAVRAIHVPTGMAVVAQEARSQHENRNLAIERLRRKLQLQEENAQSALRKRLRDQHAELERGNPVRVYAGPDYQRRA
jgi:peptide chain release factor